MLIPACNYYDVETACRDSLTRLAVKSVSAPNTSSLHLLHLFDATENAFHGPSTNLQSVGLDILTNL